MSFFVSFLTKKIFNKTSTNILGVSLLGGTRWNTPQSVQTCWNPSEPVQINPFKPVETRSDLLKQASPLLPLVETRQNPFRLTRSNLSKHVQTCWNAFPLLPPPLLPPFPLFFFGEGGGRGREREGKPPPPPKTPGRGWGGGRSPPPPPQNFNNKIKSKFSKSV